MQCSLAGGFALDDEPTLGRAITLSLEVQRPRLDLTAAVTGELSAEPIAVRRAVTGTVALGFRRARYHLRFDDDDGVPCELRGTQELALRRPPHGFSIVTGELFRNQRRFGRLRLRLDPRSLCRS